MTGQEYRDLRELKGLTRFQLATLLEIAPSTIQAREARGEAEVSKENELALLRVTKELDDVPEPIAGGGGG